MHHTVLETPEPTSATRTARIVRWTVIGGLACGILVVLAVLTQLRFGSISAGMDFLRGQRLIVDERLKSFGEVAEGREQCVIFNFTNLTGGPVQIVGATTDCTCVAVDRLPLAISHGQREQLTVRIRKGKKTGAVTEPILLYTDCAEKPELVVRIVGRIRE